MPKRKNRHCNNNKNKKAFGIKWKDDNINYRNYYKLQKICNDDEFELFMKAFVYFNYLISKLNYQLLLD